MRETDLSCGRGVLTPRDISCEACSQRGEGTPPTSIKTEAIRFLSRSSIQFRVLEPKKGMKKPALVRRGLAMGAERMAYACAAIFTLSSATRSIGVLFSPPFAFVGTLAICSSTSSPLTT
jgi:hypothetical protein